MLFSRSFNCVVLNKRIADQSAPVRVKVVVNKLLRLCSLVYAFTDIGIETLRFFEKTSRAFNHFSVGYRLLFSQRGVAAKKTLGWKVWRHDERIWDLGGAEGKDTREGEGNGNKEKKIKYKTRVKGGKWINGFCLNGWFDIRSE